VLPWTSERYENAAWVKTCVARRGWVGCEQRQFHHPDSSQLCHRLQAHHGPLSRSRHTERVLFITELFAGHFRNLPPGIGAQLTREDNPVLVDVCSAAQSLEQLVREQPVMAYIEVMRFLKSPIADHPHDSLLALLFLRPHRCSGAGSILDGQMLERQIDHDDRSLHG